MNVVIITGGSKGIGKSLSLKYFNEGFKVYSLARTKSDLPNGIKQINCDLTQTESLLKNFNSIFKEIELSKLRKITLINNAGRLGEISSIENLSLEDMQLSIQLNVTAVLQLSSLFIKIFRTISCIKNIINLSSGAASNPYSGWATYCSSKAAVDMVTKVIALEQEDATFPTKIFAIRPGVVATDMQKQIRSTNKNNFALVDKFIDLHKKKLLSTPTEVATKTFQIDTTNSIKNGEIIDLRDF